MEVGGGDQIPNPAMELEQRLLRRGRFAKRGMLFDGDLRAAISVFRAHVP